MSDSWCNILTTVGLLSGRHWECWDSVGSPCRMEDSPPIRNCAPAASLQTAGSYTVWPLFCVTVSPPYGTDKLLYWILNRGRHPIVPPVRHNYTLHRISPKSISYPPRENFSGDEQTQHAPRETTVGVRCSYWIRTWNNFISVSRELQVPRRWTHSSCAKEKICYDVAHETNSYSQLLASYGPGPGYG
jgi:hypothetical protein